MILKKIHVGDKWDTTVKSWGPKHPERKTSVGDQCKLVSGRQACETSEGQVWDNIRPKAPRLGDKCARQVGDKCKLIGSKAPRVGDKGDKWETSVNSNGPRHPERETSVGDKCKLVRLKAPKVGDKCAKQARDKCGKQV